MKIHLQQHLLIIYLLRDNELKLISSKLSKTPYFFVQQFQHFYYYALKKSEKCDTQTVYMIIVAIVPKKSLVFLNT